MNAVGDLMEEHVFILGVLDALEAWSRSSDPDLAKIACDLGEFVSVVEGYVDPIHHGKEEEILFSFMADHGFSRSGGPLGCMLSEHVHCRALVAELKGHFAQGGVWNDTIRRAASETALTYVNVLRGHIDKEDKVLYPMAERILPPDVKALVDARCLAFADAGAVARSTQLREAGAALIARYVPADARRFGVAS